MRDAQLDFNYTFFILDFYYTFFILDFNYMFLYLTLIIYFYTWL